MALKSSLITVPVTVAVLDIFGYVARVEGASMQVLSVDMVNKCHRSVLAVSAALLIHQRRVFLRNFTASGWPVAAVGCRQRKWR